MAKIDNKVVMILLTIFLGVFGIHRFFAGKIWTGLLYLLTDGVFLIGWIYDIFCVATSGKLKF